MTYHVLQNIKQSTTLFYFCFVFSTGRCYIQTSAGIRSQRHLLEHSVKTGINSEPILKLKTEF